jgi:hypothetical protein
MHHLTTSYRDTNFFALVKVDIFYWAATVVDAFIFSLIHTINAYSIGKKCGGERINSRDNHNLFQPANWLRL